MMTKVMRFHHHFYDDKNDDLNEASYGDASFSRTDKGGKSSWTEYCACDLLVICQRLIVDVHCVLFSLIVDIFNEEV